MIPRNEYPRPQFFRDEWQNLNGEWQFSIDCGKSGRERNLFEADFLEKTIIVPFCPESDLSGIGYKDFMPAVWYRRTFEIPTEWRSAGRTFVHFGAVDYETEVWINGIAAGKHRGGYTSFHFDITNLLKDGTNTITVCAEDDTRSPLQPTGKQSMQYNSYGCLYTRTTGIWQTVWLEHVPDLHLANIKITPNPGNRCVRINVRVDNPKPEMTLTAIVMKDGIDAGRGEIQFGGDTGELIVSIPSDMIELWEPGNPFLYDLKLSLCGSDGIEDSVMSYFGLRSIGIRGRALLLNGKPIFQRLILDQGFYPDGIYTAPSDEALQNNIRLSMSLGFNGARLHQKIFEERYLYWADRLGYLVWGEMASWGLKLDEPAVLEHFQTEWLEALDRDYSHPSIVGWCPFNETNEAQNPEILRQTYRVTKQIDPTRPCIDTSGYVHAGLTDVYDVHDYEQNPDEFALHYKDRLPSEEEIWADRDMPCKPRPIQPYFVSEYGGIWWNPGQEDTASWGYGNRPRTEQEFLMRYKGLTEALLNNPNMCAFCYTQLTDVELEVNGLYKYDRSPKLKGETYQAIRNINTQPAAIEGK